MRDENKDAYNRAVEKNRKRRERRKAKKDPIYAFNVKQRALLNKGENRLKKIEGELAYNKKELENLTTQGWQAKVFETRIKQPGSRIYF